MLVRCASRDSSDEQSDFSSVSMQPMRYALEQPDPLERGDALRRFFDCPEWTLEQRLSVKD